MKQAWPQRCGKANRCHSGNHGSNVALGHRQEAVAAMAGRSCGSFVYNCYLLGVWSQKEAFPVQKAHPAVNTFTRGKQVVVSGSLDLKVEDMLECMLNLQSFKILNILISRWLNKRRCIRIHPWLNWRCMWCKPLHFAQIHFFVLLRSYEKRRQYD